MKKIISGMLITMLLCSLFFAVLPTHATAADTSAEINIPVKVTVSGDEPYRKSVFKIILTPDAPTFPLPVASSNGSYVLSIEGESSGSINIEYEKTGVYTYKISQQPGENTDYTYDNTIYSITVYITYGENGELLSTVTPHYTKGSEKPENIVFENTYKLPVLPENHSKDSDSDTDTETDLQGDSDSDTEITSYLETYSEKDTETTSDKDSATDSEKDSEKDTTSKTVSSQQPTNTSSVSASSSVTSQTTIGSFIQNNPFKTGDERHIAFYIFVMIICFIGLSVNLFLNHLNKKDDSF